MNIRRLHNRHIPSALQGFITSSLTVLLLLSFSSQGRAHPDKEQETSSSSNYQSTTLGERRTQPVKQWKTSATSDGPANRSIADQLKKLPGVIVQRHATEAKGEQFIVRGFDAGHGTDVELTLHGIPLNLASHIHGHGYINLSWIPTAAVSSTTWIPGSFTIQQGAFATAGTIQINTGGFTKNGVGYRTSSTFRQHLWGRYVDPEQPDKKWFASDFVYDRGYGEQRRVVRGNFMASTTLLDRRNSKVHAQLGASASRFDVPSFPKRNDIEAGRIGFYDAYNVPGNGEAQTAWFAFPFEFRTSKRWRVDGYLSTDFRNFRLNSNTTGYLVNRDHGDARSIEDTRITLRGHASAKKTLNHHIQLRLMGEISEQLITQQSTAIDQQEQPLKTLRQLDASITSASVGAMLRWFAHKAWTADIGLRMDYLRFDVHDYVAKRMANTNKFIASPRTSLTWAPGDKLRLRLAYGRGFRPMEASSIIPNDDPSEVPTDNHDEPSPNPTITDHIELSTGWKTRHLHLRAALFGVFSADEYYYDHVSRQGISLGPTRRLGGEFAATLQPVRWLELTTTLTAVDARYTGENSHTRIPNIPAVYGLTSIKIGAFAGVSFESSLRYISKRSLPYDAISAGYAVMDASIRWQREGFQLWFGIENILDAQYAESEYIYPSAFFPDEEYSQVPRLHVAAGPPRIFHVGLSYEF